MVSLPLGFHSPHCKNSAGTGSTDQSVEREYQRAVVSRGSYSREHFTKYQLRKVKYIGTAVKLFIYFTIELFSVTSLQVLVIKF